MTITSVAWNFPDPGFPVNAVILSWLIMCSRSRIWRDAVTSFGEFEDETVAFSRGIEKCGGDIETLGHQTGSPTDAQLQLGACHCEIYLAILFSPAVGVKVLQQRSQHI